MCDGYIDMELLKYDHLREKEFIYPDYGDIIAGKLYLFRKQVRFARMMGNSVLMAEDRADHLVVNPRTMTKFTRIHLPQRVPISAHPVWLGHDDWCP
jgi:hypothetical protein